MQNENYRLSRGEDRIKVINWRPNQYGDSRGGYLKKHIARSIRRVLSKLHAETLRKDEVNYLYFKIARVEIIRPLKTEKKVSYENNAYPSGRHLWMWPKYLTIQVPRASIRWIWDDW